MTRIAVLCLFGILTAITNVEPPTAQPDCNAANATTFMPPSDPATASWFDTRNWSNGIPDDNSVACVPPEAADLAEVWHGVSRILEPIGWKSNGAPGDTNYAVADVAAASAISYSDPPPPTTQGVCCLGSDCLETDYFDCQNLGGFFRGDLFDCSLFNPCLTGACCVSDPDCIDQDLGGGSMDEELCDLTDGTYLGGASCNDSDPCQRFRLPEGFEIIDLTPSMHDLRRRHPRLNNCGVVSVHIGTESSTWEAEVYTYDNKVLTQHTDNAEIDVFPDVNDFDAMTWFRCRLPQCRRRFVQ